MLRLAENVEVVLVKSLSFAGKDRKMALRSVSFKKIDMETVLTPNGSGRKAFEKSLSFKKWEPEAMKLEPITPFKSQSMDKDVSGAFTLHSNKKEALTKFEPAKFLPELISPRPVSELDAAAVKLQKVYKSYRTRRNLADCAVVVEELWWKALDFASLKRSSVSFFNVEKPETAVSRWARARTRAAKVGKGLSKDVKAQKLALQHWLEAIDPRHRYGHNLHLYYNIWFKSESTQPFFYWLDIGDGKEINLETCPRNNLQSQCIKYLGPKERKAYEVIVERGKLVYKESQMPVHTVDGSKWIFVLCTSRSFYVGKKKKGKFQHSSFLAGGATTAAGRLVAKDGVLKAIWPYSGHYLPTEENFKEFISFLRDNEVDLTNVKRCSVDDDEYPSFKKAKDWPAMEVIEVAEDPAISEAGSLSGTGTVGRLKEPSKPMDHVEKVGEVDASVFRMRRSSSSVWSTGTGPRIGCVRDYPTDLQWKALEQVNLSPRKISPYVGNKCLIPSPCPSPEVNNHVDKVREVDASVFKLRRCSSVVWSTGAGPRIGCVRDYPTDLQSKALEQVNLSLRVISSSVGNKCPVPSPRPSPGVRVSPMLAAHMGIPRPTVNLTLPKPKKR